MLYPTELRAQSQLSAWSIATLNVHCQTSADPNSPSVVSIVLAGWGKRCGTEMHRQANAGLHGRLALGRRGRFVGCLCGAGVVSSL